VYSIPFGKNITLFRANLRLLIGFVHWAKVEIGALRWSTGTCAESHGELSEGWLPVEGR